MFYQKLKFYSNLGNTLKRLSENKYPEKFIEDKSYSYLDNNGQKVKLKYEIEREKRLFSEFIHNMSNYQKLEEGRRNNYFSRLRGYKDIYEEKKIKDQRKKRFREIFEFKKRREKYEGNKLLVNFKDLKSKIDNYLLEEKNRNIQTTKDIIYRNQDDIHKNKLQKLNHKKFLSLNSSLNSDSNNFSGKKLRGLETNTSNLMTNIIRKRMHLNKSTSELFNQKKQMNLFQWKFKKNQTLRDITPLLLSQKDTNNTNLYSNETNSFNLNLSSNIKNRKTLYNSNKIKNIKSSIDRYYFNQNNIQINGVKIEWKKDWRTKKPLQLSKIKDKNDSSLNNDEISKINSDKSQNDFLFNDTHNLSNQIIERDKRTIKLKKLNSIKLKK
jgi:hypothetical protein